MEKLHSQQHCNAFINELKIFHHHKGTPFRHLPRINGQEVDLQKLYNLVTAFGGLQKVSDQQKWNIVANCLKLPDACANFSLALRQLYIRYLGNYEKIHFVTQDLYISNQTADFHPRKQRNVLHSVPMSYNHMQHEVSDSARMAVGLNQIFCNPTDYDKLCLSLLSGLPNEQKLALNVCTILANDGKYMLRLENCPKLVNFLLAQAGIWPLDDYLLKEVCLESWDGLEGRNMKRFWHSALNRYNLKISELCNWILGDEDTDDEFLNLELDLGALNIEGQRVKTIALIFHNLSFEKNNIPILVSNSNFLRFVVLCMYTKWAELKQIAYDTISNIASAISLSIEKDLCIQVFFQTIVEGMQSSDRFLVIKSLDVLSKLCLCEANKDMIPSRIDIEAYEKMLSFLTVHDIMLLFFTLEALYELSNLGRYACEKIVGVHRSIAILVNLLTFDPNEYGPSAHFGMKLVETSVPADPNTEGKRVTVSTTSNQSFATLAGTPTSNADSKTRACNWLRLTYEYSQGSTVAGKEIYVDYVRYCGKNRTYEVVDANVFANCIHTVFSQCGLTKLISSDGTTSVHYDGLQRKNNSLSQVYPALANSVRIRMTEVLSAAVIKQNSTIPKIIQEPTYHPILKGQFSTPHQSSTNIPHLKRLIQSPTLVSKASSSPNTYTVVQNNTLHINSDKLLKDPLIDKMQRNLQQQLHSNTKQAPVCNRKQLGGTIRETLAEQATTLSSGHCKSVQNYIEKNVTDSNDSVFSDGESMNNFSSDGEKIPKFPRDVVSLDNDSLSTSSDIVLTSGVEQLNSITTQSNFLLYTESLNYKEICEPETSTVTSLLPMPVTVVQSVIQPKSSCPSSSLLKPLLGEFNPKTEIRRSLFNKDKICERSPLLNELLNKGNVSLTKDLPVFSSKNKTAFSISEMNSEDVINASEIVSPVAVMPKSNSLKEINISRAPLFGAVEVQLDEEGVVKLHIESPEKSNKSSDLSSISDVSLILECTSSNAECNSQVSFNGIHETVNTVITTNTVTSSRLGSNQQKNGFTSILNQPQVHSQSPNTNALCNSVNVEDSLDQEVSLNQDNQLWKPTVETPAVSSVTSCKKSYVKGSLPEIQKPHSDRKFPLLTAILKLPTPVSTFPSTNGVSIKPFQNNHLFPLKPITIVEDLCQTSELTVSEPVLVHDIDFPSESEIKTYCPLFTRDHSSIASATNISSSTSTELEYICKWKDCRDAFQSFEALFVHTKNVHATYSNDDMICLWEGCQLVKRGYFSHLVHLEWHCNANIQTSRQTPITQLGETTTALLENPPCSDSVPNTALLVIKRRHSLHNLNPNDLSNEKESALTKSIRLTSALILRNLVSHSYVARSCLRCYEPELVHLAMSPIESSRTIAECLSELVGSSG